MIEDSNLWYQNITSVESLYLAYKKSKRGKGFSKSSQRFQVAALDGIYQIKTLLENKRYNISKYNEFIIYEPKERIVKACSFKDKIVQHSLCDNILLPVLQCDFIKYNFAGQIGKGTLFGLDALSSHMQQAFNQYGYDCWIIKADISKFFYTIDHLILKDMIRYFVKDESTFWLCEKFVDSTEGVGLPLGNQVSQVYALLYLSGLDHFITGELGVEYYGRYMDDFYMIVNTKEQANWCLHSVSLFVESLNLKMNNKTQIIQFKNGIKFCGFHTYITENGKVIRKLTNEKKRAAKKKFKRMAYLVHKGKLSKEKLYESYNSWKNHISHGNCIKLSNEMDCFITGLMSNKN